MFKSAIGNTVLYETAVENTMSNSLLHSLLIIFEYFICIFPYVVSATQKICYLDKIYTDNDIYKSLSLLTKFKNQFIHKQSIHSSWYLYIVIGIMVFFAFLFIFMHLFLTKRFKFKILTKIFVNFYNVIFFRYFSFLFLDPPILLFLSIIMKNDGYYKSLISYAIAIALFIYISCVYHVLSNYSIFLQITNDKLVRTPVHYPYDQFSSSYELRIFLYKIIICFESNYCFLNDNKINEISIFLNTIIGCYGLFFFFEQAFFNLFTKINVIALYTSNALNLIRKIIIVSNFALVVVGFFFQTFKSTYVVVVESVISCIFGITFCFFMRTLVEKPTIIYKPETITEELIVYLMSQNIEEKSDMNTFKTKYSYDNNNTSDDSWIFKVIITNLQTNHLMSCKNKKNKCLVCEKIKDKSVDVYEKMYYIYTDIADKQKKTFYYYLILLFYYKITNNIYQFYKFYYWIIEGNRIKTPTILRNNLIFLVLNYFVSENQGTHLFLKENFMISEFDSKLKQTLKAFSEFINLNIQTKTAESIIKISKDINALQKKLTCIILDLDLKNHFINGAITSNKEQFLLKNKNKKNIVSVCKYNLTVSRYILETLVNQKFKEFNPLNIELLEDYLSFHFNSDKVIIIKTSLEDISKKSNISFSVVKISGFHNENNVAFCDYFPKNLRKEGKQKLLQHIENYINGVNDKFDFIIEKKSYIEHFTFNFEVSTTLINNNIVLFGSYTSDYDKIILLRLENKESIGKMKIINYSRIISQLLLIKPFFLELLLKNSNIRLSLESVFTKINIDQTKTQSKSETGTNYHFIDSFHCELNYGRLLKKIYPLFESISNSYFPSQEDLEKFKKDLINVQTKLTSIAAKTIGLYFTKKFEINNEYAVYLISFLSSNNSSILSKKGFPIQDTTGRANEGDGNEDDNHDIENKIFNKDLGLLTVSNSSITDQSISDKLSASSQSSSKNEKNSKTQKIIRKESTNLSIVSWVCLILNICLIIICFIFLFTQITQTEALKNVNSLYFQFKLLRAHFGNVFSTILSQICLAGSPTTTTCVNPMKNFLERYQRSINFTDYEIFDYMLYESQYKINSLKDLYTNFKSILYSYGHDKFLGLLDSSVVYFSFEQGDNELTQIKETKTFDNSILTFVNSLQIIVEREEKGYTFREAPLYFITLIDETILSDNIGDKNLLLLQHELYKVFNNFINFSLAYNNGESIIKTRFEQLQHNNEVVTWIFMIILVGMNIILICLNTKNIQIASELFKKIICTIFLKFENQELKEYLTKKLNYLITLSMLYSKRPSSIIKNINREKNKYTKESSKQQNQKNKGGSCSSDISKIETLKTENEQFIASINKESFQMIYFEKYFVFPLFLKNTFFFIFYFIIIVVCDVVLLMNFRSVFFYFNYSMAHYNLMTLIYNDFSLTYLNRFLNISDSNLATILAKDIKEDGLVNLYFRDTMESYNLAKSLREKGHFKSLGDYLPRNCQGVFNTIKDGSIDSFHTYYNLTSSDKIYLLETKICEDYQILFFHGLVFSIEDYIVVLKSVHNKKRSKVYEEMYSLLLDDSLYKAYLQMFFYIRPVLIYFTSTILTPNILNKFENYLTIVWIYLVLNIVLETLLFVLNKFLVVRELDEIKRYLFLFDNCVN